MYSYCDMPVYLSLLRKSLGQSEFSQELHVAVFAAKTHNATKYRNTLQILTMQPNTETHYKYSQCNQKHATNTHNATKYRNMMQILTMQPNTETRYKYSQSNQIQKNVMQILTMQTKYRNTL